MAKVSVAFAGFPGVVVQLTALRAIRRVAGSGTEVHVHAESGCSHSRVTRFCAEQGLTGLEFAVGIPGTVGGWLAMNAGTGEVEMKDVVQSVEWLEPAVLESREVARSELHFRYRDLDLPSGAVLLAATFRTTPGDPEEIRATMRQLSDARRATQPVDRLSCGSVFKNPPDDYAGRLIEAAGLKGAREGGAEISSTHANFIVNRANACASDVFRLIARARDEVARRFGIELETEVEILGEPEGERE